jgi:PAS domain-containing protein
MITIASAPPRLPWSYDVASDRLVWSDALHRALGSPPLPSAPTVRWWMTQVHPEDVALAASAYDRVGTGDADSWVMEYRLRAADGRWVRVRDVGTASRAPDGKLTRLDGYVELC